MNGAFSSIGESIGNTPIIHLQRMNQSLMGKLFAKCEFMNPGGSVKDRIAISLIEEAEQSGELSEGGTVVEATAGNTGMALAMICAQKGYNLVVVMTTKASEEKKTLLRTLGVEIVEVPHGLPPQHPFYFIEYARTLAKKIPGGWFADQFNNLANFNAHFQYTGPEIWTQTDGEIDVLVAGVGTGGTLCGAGAYLKSKKPSLKLVMADPIGSVLSSYITGNEFCEPHPYLVEGIGGDFLPDNANLELLDEVISITDIESLTTSMKLFKQEGIFAGGSSGCILAAALTFCKRQENKNLNVLAILPDSGRSYLSTLYNMDWQYQNGLGRDSNLG